ncbi:MAG: collagen-like protein, partial [Polyangiaceae bacterium]
MRIRRQFGFVGFAALVSVFPGCSGSDGAPGSNSLTRNSPEPAGENCASGGTKIEMGLDKNKNGALDDDEVTGAAYVCGEVSNALVETTTLDVGDANCPDGGIQIDIGIDANGNGKLDADEAKTNYACSGGKGPSGTAGPKGNTGADGATGPVGPSGSDGATGPTGSTGAVGPAGSTGATGVAGPQGDPGLTGVTGPAGSTGATGVAGPTGATGVVG